MDIQPTLLSSSVSVKAAVNLPQWSLGQLLNAKVIQRKSASTLVLQINNQAFEARTSADKPINVGTELKLVVEKQGNPVSLRVIQHGAAKSNHEIKQQLLRENMPKQASMEKLTTVLNQVANNSRDMINALPAPIEQQIKKLIAQLPTQTNLKNEAGLKTALKNSGVFLESKLLAELTNKQKPASQTQTTTPTNSPNIAKDLKTNLLQLSGVITKYKQDTQKPVSQFIRPAPLISLFEAARNSSINTKPRIENANVLTNVDNNIDIETISKQIESSIARIEVNQSKAIITNDQQLPIWSIEMPIKDKQNIDLLKLDIEYDKNSKSENEKEQLWTANLKVDFQGMGSVSARLSIIDREVSATLWSENRTLNDLIDRNLSLLKKRIENCGLTMGKIHCLAESPTEQGEEMMADNLINISV